MIVRVVDADTQDPIEGAPIICANTIGEESTRAQPWPIMASRYLRRSREYATKPNCGGARRPDVAAAKNDAAATPGSTRRAHQMDVR